MVTGFRKSTSFHHALFATCITFALGVLCCHILCRRENSSQSLLAIFFLFYAYSCISLSQGATSSLHPPRDRRHQFILPVLSSKRHPAMCKGDISYEMRSSNITIRGQYHPLRNDPEQFSLRTILFWRHLFPVTAEKSDIK